MVHDRWAASSHLARERAECIRDTTPGTCHMSGPVTLKYSRSCRRNCVEEVGHPENVATAVPDRLVHQWARQARVELSRQSHPTSLGDLLRSLASSSAADTCGTPRHPGCVAT